MKKEELQQNMKDRMQQFEDGGLRLLKKGQKGIVHAIFSRFGLVLLLIPGGSISQEMHTTALAVSLTTLAMGNVAFLLYDRALHNMLQAYRILWQPRLHKMLGR